MSVPRITQRAFVHPEEHYIIEKELANRLRSATKAERRKLYNTIYDELNQRVPRHRRALQAIPREVRARAMAAQVRLLLPFIKLETVFLEIGPGECEVSMQIAKRVKK